MSSFKPLILSVAFVLCALLSAASSHADNSVLPAVPTPEPISPAGGFSGNIGLYSQYVIRGVTYSREKPALQGDIQYDFPNGWYIGLWASNVSRYTIYGAPMETDPYGGYIGSVGDVT